LHLPDFVQPATVTHPSGCVCIRSNVTLNCTVRVNSTGVTRIGNAEWRRNGVIITDSSSGHTLLRTEPESTPVITGLTVDSTILDDDGTVYTCTAENAPVDFISTITLNVAGGN